MAAETKAFAAAPAPDTAAKVSRYRSVRRAQEQQQHLRDMQHQQQQMHPMPAMPAMPALPPMPASCDSQKDAGVTRSMSRYHRRPGTSNSAATKAPPVRSNTEIVPPLPANALNTATMRNRALSSPQQVSRAPNEPRPRMPNTSRARAEPTPLVAQGGRGPSDTARQEAKQLMQLEAERQKRMQDKLRAEKKAKQEAEQAERERQEKLRQEEDEAERLRAQREADEAEQLRRQKEEQDRGKRLQKAESARHLKKREEEERKAKFEEASRKQTPSQASSPPLSPRRNGFGIFKRRKEDGPGSPEAANSGRPRQTSSGQHEPDTIRPGGGGAVLGIDAPISAVNAGDRRVMVVCGSSHILLPVTPTTTAMDLIKSAANCLTENINVRHAAIQESFTKVGLTRPIRYYEHVRDILNSWDDDKQNDLVIVDAIPSQINQDLLSATLVPDTKPEGMDCYIHYSSRPGKWSKRFISFREDGQLAMSKSDTSKDSENICHLSDFDIYSPTERKLAKSVKPPKKICFAVKSQQKSTMFMDESRFVHFFCTNDRNTATKFYRTLQGWRSWYLKHVMGEGKKAKAAEPAPASGYSATRNNAGTAGAGKDFGLPSHSRGASVGSHYQLGSFAPLMDMEQFSKEPNPIQHIPDDAPLAKFDTRAMHQRKMSTRVKGGPPLSYNLGAAPPESITPSSSSSQLVNSAQNAGQEKNKRDTFEPTGLLGRSYSTRQRQVQEREKKNTGPFTDGPNLLNNIDTGLAGQATTNDSGLARRSSVRSNHRRTSSDLQRGASMRWKPKPLVDLTPQYREPPQHANKGKGFRPDGSAGPLVENATSPEEAIKVPSATDWRAGRPSTSRGQGHGTYGVGGHERTRSLRGGHNRGEGLAAYTVNNHTCTPEDESNAFTGGLLARTGFSQGYKPVGHGVMDGSKAKGPMLDMREQSKFAYGSLLANVPDKRRSVDLG